MKVCLIYVGIGVSGFCDQRPTGDREGSWIGHGIASIGSAVEVAGYEVSLIDLRKLSGADDLVKKISEADADVFGLSVSPVDFQTAPMVAKLIKHFHPESKVVVGGIHPTIFPDAYNLKEIDTVVIGEGEITFPKLLLMYEWGVSFPKTIRGEKPNLDTLSFVNRELFDYKRELDCVFAPDQKTPSITMLAGRGCPFQCTYCQPAENSVFGKPYRMRSPENVIKELIQLKNKYDFKSITFWDDTFTISKRWTMQFCDLYEKENFGASIAACSRADIICRNEDMVERLASIGVDWFVIGMESGSQRLLDFIKKGTTVEQNIKSAEICRKNGIKIFATFMLGLPTEIKAESLSTAIMIDKIAPEHPSAFYFYPIEGTEIHKFCQDNDLILKDGNNRTIARTGVFEPAIKGIDYKFLDNLRTKEGYEARQMLREGARLLDWVLTESKKETENAEEGRDRKASNG